MKDYKVVTKLTDDDLKTIPVKAGFYDKEDRGITITVIKDSVARRIFIPWDKVEYIEEILS